MLTDEEMDEIGIEWWGVLAVADRQMEQHDTDEEAEAADLELREAEYLQANCGHENASEEPCGYVHRSGAVELHLVCHDCGLTKPLGVYDSIL